MVKIHIDPQGYTCPSCDQFVPWSDLHSCGVFNRVTNEIDWNPTWNVNEWSTCPNCGQAYKTAFGHLCFYSPVVGGWPKGVGATTDASEPITNPPEPAQARLDKLIRLIDVVVAAQELVEDWELDGCDDMPSRIRLIKRLAALQKEDVILP